MRTNLTIQKQFVCLFFNIVTYLVGIVFVVWSLALSNFGFFFCY